MPYDIVQDEIYSLVREFADIDEVVIPRNSKGMTHGYCFVYLKDEKDVEKTINMVDGRHIRGRELRVRAYIPSEEQPVQDREALADALLAHAKHIKSLFVTYHSCEETENVHCQAVASYLLQEARRQGVAPEDCDVLTDEFSLLENEDYKWTLLEGHERTIANLSEYELQMQENAEKFPLLYSVLRMEEALAHAKGISLEQLLKGKRESVKVVEPLRITVPKYE